jgi:hypothetical protein
MAMRSQVYAWDLYKGTTVTGQPLTTSMQSNTLSPIKTITSYGAGSPPAGNYTVGQEYYFVNISPGSAIGTGGAIIPTIVSGGGTAIDAETLTQRGESYKLNDILGVVGDIVTPNINLFQYQVTSIYSFGFGYATGITPTTTTTGSGSGMTINITSVTAAGEIFSYTIQESGDGYAVGDTVTIDGGTSYNVTLTINSINYTRGTRYIDLGKSFSIFTEKGNTLKTKPKTKESQFIVVESFGCSPTAFYPGETNGASWDVTDYRGSPIRNSLGGPRAYLQFYINTTGYFKDSDGVPRDGIPGNSAPYPLTTQFSVCSERKQSPVYILPLQTWDLFMICYNDNLGDGNQTQILSTQQGQLQAFFKYTLYDGVDCIIALRLLESSISITPENIDMFKRNLYQNNITLPNDALEEPTEE